MNEPTRPEERAHVSDSGLFRVGSAANLGWCLIARVQGDRVAIRVDEDGHRNNHARLTREAARALGHWLLENA